MCDDCLLYTSWFQFITICIELIFWDKKAGVNKHLSLIHIYTGAKIELPALFVDPFSFWNSVPDLSLIHISSILCPSFFKRLMISAAL